MLAKERSLENDKSFTNNIPSFLQFKLCNFVRFQDLSYFFLRNGKKDGVPRDDILKDAIANAQLWESRLGATESAKNDYR